MKGIGLYEAEQNAQMLGATHYRTYFTDSRHSFLGEKKPEPFSVHFFNDDDEEIGMYSMSMGHSASHAPQVVQAQISSLVITSPVNWILL